MKTTFSTATAVIAQYAAISPGGDCIINPRRLECVMEVRSIRYFRFWLFLAVIFGFLAGFGAAVTTVYSRMHRDLLDLRYMQAPLAGVVMLQWAIISGVKLTKCYRDVLSAYNKRITGVEAISLPG